MLQGLRPDPAVKRIMQEARELANYPCTDYAAAPLEVSRMCGQPSPEVQQILPLPQDDIFVSTKPQGVDPPGSDP